jgi:hypothetical protein
MCGTWGYQLCTPKRLFDFLGDVQNNLYVPFQISYEFDPKTPEGIVPYNSQIIPCNETVDVSCFKEKP